MIEKMPLNGGRTKPVKNAAESVPLSKPVSVKKVLKHKTKKLKELKKQSDALKTIGVKDKRSSNGGARPGAGRKPGKQDKKTLDRLERARQIRDRIAYNADRILNAQLDLAIGQTFLFVKVTERDSKGKIVRSYHERITDEQTIIDYLDGNLDDDGERFHYISTKPANNLAIQDLLNRGLGKPVEKMEMTGADGGPIQTEVKTGAVVPDNSAMIRLSKALEKALNEPRTDISANKQP